MVIIGRARGPYFYHPRPNKRQRRAQWIERHIQRALLHGARPILPGCSWNKYTTVVVKTASQETEVAPVFNWKTKQRCLSAERYDMQMVLPCVCKENNSNWSGYPSQEKKTRKKINLKPAKTGVGGVEQTKKLRAT